MSKKSIIKNDFIKNLPLYNNKSKLIENKYLLFIKTHPQTTKEPIINFTLIKKYEKIFFKDFNSEKFNELKIKIGLECSLSDFMKSFIKNIKEKDNIIIEEINNKLLLMKITFNISKGININVVINFEDFINYDSKTFNHILMDILFNLYDEKKEFENDIKNINNNHKLLNINNNDNENSFINNSNLDLINIYNFFETKKNLEEENKKKNDNEINKKKRKFRANLINPNIKKRNKKAINYISEEEEEDNNKEINNEEENDNKEYEKKNKKNNSKDKKE